MEHKKTEGRSARLGWIMALAAVAVVGVWLLSSNAAAENEAPASSPSADGEVLARIGEVEITRSEVEAAIGSELQALDRQRHELLEKGLDAAINERLLEIGAAAKGMDKDAYLKSEVSDKLAAVTDADVDRFYEERKAQIQQPKEAVAARIREYLQQTRQQEAVGKMVSTLRVEHEPQVFLEPIRIQVESAGAPSFGPATAPVTIVEFSDFQCPFCSKVLPTLDRVKEEYGDKVRLVFRQFPLNSIHPQAQKAAEASLCAEDQGKFWEMHDAMFENQRALGVADLKSAAEKLELDASAFGDCLDSGKYAQQVNADLQAGIAAGVTGTPAMFINGRFLSGAQSFDAIARVIEDELRRAEG